ncbi:MAG: hypothetical protein ACRC57_00525 [Sarcina sp.]
MRGNKDISKSKPNDILYGYLQMMSTTDGKDKNIEKRFLYKKNYSHSQVEEHFGYDENGKPYFPRKNAERAFKVLIQYGYVVESEIIGLKNSNDKIYELPYNVDEVFQYIELETLKFMLRTCNPNVIKLYIFFKYKYFCFGNEFVFTDKMLLNECFGVSSNTNKKTNDELKDRLKMLRILGLIDWCEFTIINKDGKPVPQKRLTLFSDKIKEINY